MGRRSRPASIEDAFPYQGSRPSLFSAAPSGLRPKNRNSGPQPSRRTANSTDSHQEFLHGRYAVLLGGGLHGGAEGDGFQVVAAADLGRFDVLQRAQDLGHRADERVGEPDLGPARLEPVAG